MLSEIFSEMDYYYLKCASCVNYASGFPPTRGMNKITTITQGYRFATIIQSITRIIKFPMGTRLIRV